MKKPKKPVIPAGEFKARCLELMDDVRAHHIEIIITKYGKPVARLVPVDDETPDIVGYMKGSVTVHGDIISPVDAPWEAAQ